MGCGLGYEKGARNIDQAIVLAVNVKHASLGEMVFSSLLCTCNY